MVLSDEDFYLRTMIQQEQSNRGPLYGNETDHYFLELSESVISTSVDNSNLYETKESREPQETLGKQRQPLPRQYILPLMMLESSIRTNPSYVEQKEFGVDSNLLFEAIQPKNLMHAFEIDGLCDKDSSCLAIPITDQLVVHLSGVTTVRSDFESTGASSGESLRDIEIIPREWDLQTSLFITGSGHRDHVVLLSAFGAAEITPFILPPSQITDPAVAQFYGWDRELMEDVISQDPIHTQVTPETNVTRLNKYVSVAQRVVRGAVDSRESNFEEVFSEGSTEMKQALMDQLFNENVEILPTTYIPELGEHGKSVLLYLPESGEEVEATLLGRCEVKISDSKTRDISYFLVLNSVSEENQILNQTFKLTCTIDEDSSEHSYSIEEIGDLDTLQERFAKGTTQSVEEEEIEVAPYVVIPAENYVQHILDRLPHITEEGDIIALQAMKMTPNGPQIEDLVDALIEKRKLDPHIPIHLSLSKASVESPEDAEAYKSMYKAGIQLHWTDQPRNHPYSGYNHRKLFVLGKECGYGGVNLEADSLGFADWMISFPDNEVVRKIIQQKIINESEPFRSQEMEFELFQVTPGRESYIPTDSKLELEKFIEASFKNELMGFVSENAYTDQESALIEAAVMAINRAERSVTIMGQWMPDGRVREALLAALERTPGLKVNIISNSGRAHINQAIPHRDWKDKIVYGGAFYLTQTFWTRSFLNLFRKLSGGVDGNLKIQTTDKKLVHAKIIFVDDKVMIHGSDNFIESGAKYRTREAGFIISVEEIVKEMIERVKEFREDPEMEWNHR